MKQTIPSRRDTVKLKGMSKSQKERLNNIINDLRNIEEYLEKIEQEI